MIYIGLLHVELAHCHPVLRVFCEELLKSSNTRKEQTDVRLHSAESIGTSSVVANYRSTTSISAKAYSAHVINRWMKTITLYNNPSLCKTSTTNTKFEQPE